MSNSTNTLASDAIILKRRLIVAQMATAVPRGSYGYLAGLQSDTAENAFLADCLTQLEKFCPGLVSQFRETITEAETKPTARVRYGRVPMRDKVQGLTQWRSVRDNEGSVEVYLGSLATTPDGWIDLATELIPMVSWDD